jgi:hypothetical protein
MGLSAMTTTTKDGKMNTYIPAARQKIAVVALGAGVLVWAVIVHHLGAPPLPLHCVPPDHPVTSWYPDSQLWRAQIPGLTDGADSVHWFGSTEIGGCGESLTITTGTR